MLVDPRVTCRVYEVGFTAGTIWAANFDIEKRSLLLSWHFGKMSVDRKRRCHLKWSQMLNTLDYVIFKLSDRKSARVQDLVASSPYLGLQLASGAALYTKPGMC